MKWVTGLLMVVGMMSVQADELAEAKAAFVAQDKALNAVYETLKKELSPELFAKVQEDQRAWVEYRDYMTNRQKAEGLKTSESAESLTSAAEITKGRIDWLKAWTKLDKRKGWSGKYSDSRGGFLQIAEKDGNVFFVLDVVRGPSFHIGGIDGKISVNGNTGWFETKAEGEEKPTWLTFLDGLDYEGSVRVTAENTSYFHGARGYFQGTYLWTGELSAEDRKKVIEGKHE